MKIFGFVAVAFAAVGWGFEIKVLTVISLVMGVTLFLSAILIKPPHRSA